MSIGEEIIAKYLKSQHNLLRFENVGQDSCLLSLPLNFTAHTRVELAVTRLSSDQYILTDQGQTLGELHDAGYAINAKLLERLKQIIKVWQVELAGVTLTRTTKEKDLGNALHDFARRVARRADGVRAHGAHGPIPVAGVRRARSREGALQPRSELDRGADAGAAERNARADRTGDRTI